MFEEQVRRGAALLDEKNPGWHRKINLSTLSLSSITHCILGQLYGGYGRGKNELEIIGQPSSEYGFDLPPRGSVGIWSLERERERVRMYAELQDTWVKVIQEEGPAPMSVEHLAHLMSV